jgi:hypothetical protein
LGRVRRRFVGHQRVRKRLQLLQLPGLVEVARRRGRLDAEPEAQGAGAVVRRMQQIAELVELAADLLGDHPLSPVVGPRVAQRAEHAAQPHRFEGGAAQAQLDGIDLQRVGALARRTGPRRRRCDPPSARSGRR